jgi:hypothetical protein
MAALFDTFERTDASGPQGELGLQIPLVWSGICCDRGDIVCRGAGGNVGDRVAAESRMSGEGQSQASRSGS